MFASLIGATRVAAALDFRNDPYRYNVIEWELHNFPAKWLYEFGELFRAGRSRDQQDRDLLRFFELAREIEVLERDLGDVAMGGVAGRQRAGELEARYRERGRLENGVEDSIEGRVTAMLKAEGITTPLPILGDMLWPPVDFEFADSPRSLVVSPRDRIELIDSYLLRADLDLGEIEQIEDRRAEDDGVSTLAFETGGIGAYPTIIAYSEGYRTTLERVAHEWAHNYLFFQPLGFNYYDNNDLRTMNETVADIAGHDVANAVIARWPLEAPTSEPPMDRTGPQVDVRAELRQLRGEVDALLAEGAIEEAEALMEQRRRELADSGIYFRKLNQAYFAFTNLYAGEAGAPGATNPIGPKLDELRRRSASLRDFILVVQDFTSVAQLDRWLTEGQ
ncbi:MAG: hypothetical protein GEU75_06570 [Dehalococcoidia bacterium]|nr:hypothetical protein [Dehalococcoidia bacterium]